MNDSSSPSKNPKDAEGVLRTLPRTALPVAVILVIGYLRVVFRILSDSAAVLRPQRYKYVKLFRAQLDRDELERIALNLWLDGEGKKMVSLAKKYGLLKHLQPGPLRNWLKMELPSGVFGRRQAIAVPAFEQPEVSPC